MQQAAPLLHCTSAQNLSPPCTSSQKQHHPLRNLPPLVLSGLRGAVGGSTRLYSVYRIYYTDTRLQPPQGYEVQQAARGRAMEDERRRALQAERVRLAQAQQQRVADQRASQVRVYTTTTHYYYSVTLLYYEEERVRLAQAQHQRVADQRASQMRGSCSRGTVVPLHFYTSILLYDFYYTTG